jgi:O-antigen ligase/tetratricopeptide (TPR) repeat protein
MELLLLLMVCLSPWALGGEGAEYELWLYIGLAGLLFLWAARIVARWRISWRNCPVALALAVVFMAGAVQLAPLSKLALVRLSPGTARMYDRLLPQQEEVPPTAESTDLESDLAPPLSSAPIGATISLYPNATRKALVRILAVFLLFVVVRNEIASPAALRRLSIAVLVNGALLSLFGLVQFFSSKNAGTIYWSIPSHGSVFGPFVNRNHFAFYINISLGLALGLLLMRGRRSERGPDQVDGGDGRGPAAQRHLFGDPTSLWISGGMALMLSGVVFSLSRGGFVALLGAATVSMLLTLSRRHGAWRAGTVLLTVAIALSLLIWFGLGPIETRFATLWTGEALRDGRGYVLTHAWPLVAQFPLWGSGYGTFQYVEPIYMHTAADVGKAYVHAHNDYLEDLIEGGLFRLVLRLIALGLIFRFGYRAFRRHARQSLGALALGALFAFTTIMIHSFVEFGLYLPAIAVLATVVCAHLCALGEQDAPSIATRQRATRAIDEPRRGVYSGKGVAPLLGAATAVLLGWFLWAHGVRTASIEGHLAAAARAAGGNRARELQHLRAAAVLDPRDADLQSKLAEAHFEMRKSELPGSEDDRETPRPVLTRPSAKEHKRPAADPPEERRLLANSHLVAALAHAVRARDLCPLLPRPNAWLAVYASHFRQADAPIAYMERAKFLAPMNPELWYLCGLQELSAGQTRMACESWRRSLQLSDAFLVQILDESSARLDAAALLNRVLPERPRVLLLAAEYLYPDSVDAAEREPLLRKAIALFDEQVEPLSAEDWRIRALVHALLQQPNEAVAAYRAALAKEPLRLEWRYELATLLYEQGLLAEAQQEVRSLLDQEPRHGGGRQLADVLMHQLATGAVKKK